MQHLGIQLSGLASLNGSNSNGGQLTHSRMPHHAFHNIQEILPGIIQSLALCLVAHWLVADVSEHGTQHNLKRAGPRRTRRLLVELRHLYGRWDGGERWR